MEIVKNIPLEVALVPLEETESLMLIERAGRVCKNSEHMITDNSYLGFIDRMIDSGHHGVLEMSNVIYRFDPIDFNFNSVLIRSKFLNFYIDFDSLENYIYIFGNLRAWLDLAVKTYPSTKSIYKVLDQEINCLAKLSGCGEPYRCKSHNETPFEVQRFYALFQTDRAVTHEFVRHRPCSFLQQSQRYIKQGDSVRYTEQFWWNSLSEAEMEEVLDDLRHNESRYHRYLQSHPSEQARFILANGTTSLIYVCADLSEWKLIYDLRTSSTAYKQFRNLLVSAYNMFPEKFIDYVSIS